MLNRGQTIVSCLSDGHLKSELAQRLIPIQDDEVRLNELISSLDVSDRDDGALLVAAEALLLERAYGYGTDYEDLYLTEWEGCPDSMYLRGLYDMMKMFSVCIVPTLDLLSLSPDDESALAFSNSVMSSRVSFRLDSPQYSPGSLAAHVRTVEEMQALTVLLQHLNRQGSPNVVLRGDSVSGSLDEIRRVILDKILEGYRSGIPVEWYVRLIGEIE